MTGDVVKASAPGPSDGSVETTICETAPALTEKFVLTALASPELEAVSV